MSVGKAVSEQIWAVIDVAIQKNASKLAPGSTFTSKYEPASRTTKGVSRHKLKIYWTLPDDFEDVHFIIIEIKPDGHSGTYITVEPDDSTIDDIIVLKLVDALTKGLPPVEVRPRKSFWAKFV